MNVRRVLDAFDFPADMQELFPSGRRRKGVQNVTFILGESQGMDDRFVNAYAAVVVGVVVFCLNDGEGRRRMLENFGRGKGCLRREWPGWGRHCILCILIRARWL